MELYAMGDVARPALPATAIANRSQANRAASLYLQTIDTAAEYLESAAVCRENHVISDTVTDCGRTYCQDDALNFSYGGALSAVTNPADTVAMLEECTPSRDGYRFAGWFEDEALTRPVTQATLTADNREEFPSTNPAAGDADLWRRRGVADPAASETLRVNGTAAAFRLSGVTSGKKDRTG